MQAGDLTDRVVIATRSASADTQGGRAVTWVDLLSGTASAWTKLWAKVEPVSTAETLPPSTAITATQRYRVTVNYRPAITAAMRVLWTPYRGSQKTLEIHGVRLVTRACLELDCAEVV